jgi:hypothetical protein
MKTRLIYLSILAISMMFLTAAHHNPEKSLPEAVLQAHPENDCELWGQTEGWDLRAQVITAGGVNYLVIHFKPPFTMTREPSVSSKTGVAVFEKQIDDRYIYRMGNLPKFREIGTVSFVTNQVIRGKNKIEKLKLERKDDTTCLKVIN